MTSSRWSVGRGNELKWGYISYKLVVVTRGISPIGIVGMTRCVDCRRDDYCFSVSPLLQTCADRRIGSDWWTYESLVGVEIDLDM